MYREKERPREREKRAECGGGAAARSGNKGHDDMPHQIKAKEPKVKKRLRLAGCCCCRLMLS